MADPKVIDSAQFLDVFSQNLAKEAEKTGTRIAKHEGGFKVNDFTQDQSPRLENMAQRMEVAKLRDALDFGYQKALSSLQYSVDKEAFLTVDEVVDGYRVKITVDKEVTKENK